jgi:hypothetical protein
VALGSLELGGSGRQIQPRDSSLRIFPPGFRPPGDGLHDKVRADECDDQEQDEQHGHG